MLKRILLVALLGAIAVAAFLLMSGAATELSAPGVYPIEGDGLAYEAWFPHQPVAEWDGESHVFWANEGSSKFSATVGVFNPPISDSEAADFLDRDTAVADAQELARSFDGKVLAVTRGQLLGADAWIIDVLASDGYRFRTIIGMPSRSASVALAYGAPSDEFDPATWARLRTSLRER